MLFCCTCDVVVSCCFLRSEYECFQIELSKNYGVSEWREDIKSIMMKAGLNNLQITFLFADTQVNFMANLNKIILSKHLENIGILRIFPVMSS